MQRDQYTRTSKRTFCEQSSFSDGIAFDYTRATDFLVIQSSLGYHTAQWTLNESQSAVTVAYLIGRGSAEHDGRSEV